MGFEKSVQLTPGTLQRYERISQIFWDRMSLDAGEGPYDHHEMRWIFLKLTCGYGDAHRGMYRRVIHSALAPTYGNVIARLVTCPPSAYEMDMARTFLRDERAASAPRTVREATACSAESAGSTTAISVPA